MSIEQPFIYISNNNSQYTHKRYWCVKIIFAVNTTFKKTLNLLVLSPSFPSFIVDGKWYLYFYTFLIILYFYNTIRYNMFLIIIPAMRNRVWFVQAYCLPWYLSNKHYSFFPFIVEKNIYISTPTQSHPKVYLSA